MAVIKVGAATEVELKEKKHRIEDALGLTLSRRLAELMDGSLTYVEGDGTTFRLVVPLPTPDDR